MKSQVTAGIDIGGTKVALALQDPAGEKIASRKILTRTELGPDKILENILREIEEMLDETGAELTAIGLVCPGPIDIEQGLVLSPTNLPDWVRFPIVDKIRARFPVRIVFDNDANAAAIGEFKLGAGRAFLDILYVTVSTGIGGAVISNGRLLSGIGAGAGEIGHSIVKYDGELCGCGTRGCLETIASGQSIARRARVIAEQDKSGQLSRLVDGKTDRITAKTVIEAVRGGDRAALQIWEETIFYLAIGIGNAITLFAPEAVVVGGGIALSGDLLLDPLRRHLRQNVNILPIEKVAILGASLGGESGVNGALLLCGQADERGKTLG